MALWKGKWKNTFLRHSSCFSAVLLWIASELLKMRASEFKRFKRLKLKNQQAQLMHHSLYRWWKHFSFLLSFGTESAGFPFHHFPHDLNIPNDQPQPNTHALTHTRMCTHTHVHARAHIHHLSLAHPSLVHGIPHLWLTQESLPRPLCRFLSSLFLYHFFPLHTAQSTDFICFTVLLPHGRWVTGTTISCSYLYSQYLAQCLMNNTF